LKREKQKKEGEKKEITGEEEGRDSYKMIATTRTTTRCKLAMKKSWGDHGKCREAEKKRTSRAKGKGRTQKLKWGLGMAQTSEPKCW